MLSVCLRIKIANRFFIYAVAEEVLAAAPPLNKQTEKEATVSIAAVKEISGDAAGAAVLSTATATSGSSHSRKYWLYLRERRVHARLA